MIQNGVIITFNCQNRCPSTQIHASIRLRSIYQEALSDQIRVRPYSCSLTWSIRWDVFCSLTPKEIHLWDMYKVWTIFWVVWSFTLTKSRPSGFLLCFLKTYSPSIIMHKSWGSMLTAITYKKNYWKRWFQMCMRSLKGCLSMRRSFRSIGFAVFSRTNWVIGYHWRFWICCSFMEVTCCST